MPIARAPRRARCLRALAIAAGVIAAPLATGSGSASAQSLFEALFGRSAFQPAPQIYAPPPPALPGYAPSSAPRHKARGYAPKRITREGVRERLDRGERRVVHNEAGVKPAPYVAPPVMPGPLGRFLRDPTLRRGDVVATADGLMVFRGSSGSRHTFRDFAPLSQSASLVSGKARTELAKLDGVVRSRDNYGHTPSGSEVAENDAPIVAQDDSVRSRR
jgi:hypothetical protein